VPVASIKEVTAIPADASRKIEGAPTLPAPPSRPIEDATTVAIPAAPAGDAPILDHDDPRVNEWIERFIKPDEPRFGELLVAAAQSLKPEAPVRMREPRVEVAETTPPGASERDSTMVAGDLMLVRPHRGQRRGDRRQQGQGDRREQGQGDRRRRSATRRLPLARFLPTATALMILMGAIALIVMQHGRHPAPQTAPVSVAPATPVRPSPHAAAPRPRSQRFSLDVGTYMTLDQAEAERDRIMASTGLKGWLITESRDGTEVYRVVLGVYSTRERAEVSASELIRSAVVSEAAVVPLPSRRHRK
jgi:hypothetical protein